MSATNLGAPLYLGGTLGKGNVRGVMGGINSPVFVYEITPVAIATNNIATAQAVAGAGNLTLNGTLVTAGVATFDVPRSVQTTSTGSTDTTQTLTFYGTDYIGQTMAETVTLNGTNVVLGAKAFLTVTRIAASGVAIGSVSAGTGDKFGVPYRINKKGSMQAFWDATWNSGSGTTTIGSSATATATTGDVRGTYLPATASDGTRTLALWVYMDDVDTKNGLYGVDQYAG